MKVILMKEVAGLGKEGDVVKVKPGYARNYLIPKKFALKATTNAMNALKREEEKERVLAERQKKHAETLKEKLAKISLTISKQTGDEEKIFGSVTAQEIAAKLATEGVKVDKKQIDIEEPIKALGIYNIKIKLHPEVFGRVKMWVVKE